MRSVMGMPVPWHRIDALPGPGQRQRTPSSSHLEIPLSRLLRTGFAWELAGPRRVTTSTGALAPTGCSCPSTPTTRPAKPAEPAASTPTSVPEGLARRRRGHGRTVASRTDGNSPPRKSAWTKNVSNSVEGAIMSLKRCWCGVTAHKWRRERHEGVDQLHCRRCGFVTNVEDEARQARHWDSSFSA